MPTGAIIRIAHSAADHDTESSNTTPPTDDRESQDHLDRSRPDFDGASLRRQDHGIHKTENFVGRPVPDYGGSANGRIRTECCRDGKAARLVVATIQGNSK